MKRSLRVGLGVILASAMFTVTLHANSITYEITGRDSAHITNFLVIKKDRETEHRISSATKLQISNYRAYEAITGSPLRAKVTMKRGLPGITIYFDEPVSKGYKYWIEENWQSSDPISREAEMFIFSRPGIQGWDIVSVILPKEYEFISCDQPYTQFEQAGKTVIKMLRENPDERFTFTVKYALRKQEIAVPGTTSLIYENNFASIYRLPPKGTLEKASEGAASFILQQLAQKGLTDILAKVTSVLISKLGGLFLTFITESQEVGIPTKTDIVVLARNELTNTVQVDRDLLPLIIVAAGDCFDYGVLLTFKHSPELFEWEIVKQVELLDFEELSGLYQKGLLQYGDRFLVLPKEPFQLSTIGKYRITADAWCRSEGKSSYRLRVVEASREQMIDEKFFAKAPGDFLMYENSEYGIRIGYPREWTKKEDFFGSIVFLLSPQEDASDTFRENFNIGVQELPTTASTLDELTKLGINQNRQLITDFDLIKSEAASLAGMPAHRIVFMGKEGQYNLKWMQTWTLHNNKLWVVTFTAEVDKYSKFIGTIEKMIESFGIFQAVSSKVPTKVEQLRNLYDERDYEAAKKIALAILEKEPKNPEVNVKLMFSLWHLFRRYEEISDANYAIQRATWERMREIGSVCVRYLQEGLKEENFSFLIGEGPFQRVYEEFHVYIQDTVKKIVEEEAEILRGIGEALGDMRKINQALERYYAEHSRYPSETEGLNALTPSYIDSIPVGPFWKTPYRYYINDARTAWLLVWDGPDGDSDVGEDDGTFSWSEAHRALGQIGGPGSVLAGYGYTPSRKVGWYSPSRGIISNGDVGIGWPYSLSDEPTKRRSQANLTLTVSPSTWYADEVTVVTFTLRESSGVSVNLNYMKSQWYDEQGNLMWEKELEDVEAAEEFEEEFGTYYLYANGGVRSVTALPPSDSSEAPSGAKIILTMGGTDDNGNFVSASAEATWKQRLLIRTGTTTYISTMSVATEAMDPLLRKGDEISILRLSNDAHPK